MASQLCLRLSVVFCALAGVSACEGEDVVRSAQPAGDVPPSVGQTILANVLAGIPVFDASQAKPAASPSTPAGIAAPTTVLYLRVSGEFLSERFARTVSRTKPVTDLILGTRITGESQTDGQTRLRLVPSDNRFLADVEFIGTVHSRTTGHHGPAILHYETDSTFRATKRISLSADGFATESARADAKSRPHLKSVESRVSGLFGNLVKSIARRRAAQSSARATAIVSQHTANTVANDLDHGVEKSLGTLAGTLTSSAGLSNSGLAELTSHDADPSLRVHFRTTTDYVELAMCSDATSWDDLLAGLPKISGNPHVALRVHHHLASQVATGSTATPPIARLLLASLQAKTADGTTTPGQSPGVFSTHSPRCSFDCTYLAIDIDRAEKPSSPIADANEQVPALAGADALGQ